MEYFVVVAAAVVAVPAVAQLDSDRAMEHFRVVRGSVALVGFD